MKSTWLMIFLLAIGCSDATSKAKSDNADPSGANNSGATNNSTTMNGAAECADHEVLAGDSCAPQENLSISITAVTNLPQGFEDAMACKWVIEDLEAFSVFEDFDEVVARTENCRVTRRLEERNADGIGIGGNDFGEMTVIGPGVEAPIDEVIGGESESDFEGCRTSASVDFAYSTEYRVSSTGGADAPAFELAAQTPGEFDIECRQPVAGEDFVVEWTPVGAERVIIESDGAAMPGSVEIRCAVDDSGRFVIPAELTEFIGDEEHTIYVQGWNRTTQVIDGIEVNLDTRSMFSCFGR